MINFNVRLKMKGVMVDMIIRSSEIHGVWKPLQFVRKKIHFKGERPKISMQKTKQVPQNTQSDKLLASKRL